MVGDHLPCNDPPQTTKKLGEHIGKHKANYGGLSRKLMQSAKNTLLSNRTSNQILSKASCDGRREDRSSCQSQTIHETYHLIRLFSVWLFVISTSLVIGMPSIMTMPMEGTEVGQYSFVSVTIHVVDFYEVSISEEQSTPLTLCLLLL